MKIQDHAVEPPHDQHQAPFTGRKALLGSISQRLQLDSAVPVVAVKVGMQAT
ncbi:hypothetical protein [Streptomyces sp. NPDC055709]